MMRFSVPPGYGRSRPPARPKLDPFTKIIDQILDDDGSMPTKQRHTAKRIFERLRDEHGYRAARRTSLRRSKVGGSSPSSRLGTAAWNGSTACPQSGDPNGCTAICPLMRPAARAYPHQGHGPRADPTGPMRASGRRSAIQTAVGPAWMTIMTEMTPSPTPALDYDSTLIMTVEISDEKWMVAAQVPGLARVTSKRTVMPEAEELMAAVEGYQRRAATAGCDVKRVIVAYEAGRSAFWLARWLSRRGVAVHVIQPSSVPVDRRLRRAKSDGIDVELLLRTLLAWLRGEPRVCSMVPIPDPVDEDARRFVRERQELLGERIALSNRIDAVLATLGNPWLRPAPARSAGALGAAADGLGRSDTTACPCEDRASARSSRTGARPARRAGAPARCRD